jgi:hypothetical protein
LLGAAQKASGQDDDDVRLAVVRRLNAFVLESFPNTPEILALDALAIAAAEELSVSVASGAGDRIAARTGALRSIATRLDAVSSTALEAAATVRLEKAHCAADALTEAVRAVDDLNDALEDGSDRELRKRLAKLAQTMRELRRQVDSAVRRPG